jgi:hypothetical protein
MMSRFQQTRRDFFAARGWRALSKAFEYLGNVRSWEVTDSPTSGWHAHTHEFLSFRDHNPRHELHDYYPTAWADACKRNGLYASRSFGTRVDPVDATTYATAARYTCAWGPEQELSLSPFKTAKGGNRTVWDLLTAATMGNDEGAARWDEYSIATFGRKRLSWSGTMRDYIADRRTPDIPDGQEIEWTTINKYEWSILHKARNDVRILSLLSLGDEATARQLITKAQLDSPMYDRHASYSP